jgi:hypothetical protein
MNNNIDQSTAVALLKPLHLFFNCCVQPDNTGVHEKVPVEKNPNLNPKRKLQTRLKQRKHRTEAMYPVYEVQNKDSPNRCPKQKC